MAPKSVTKSASKSDGAQKRKGDGVSEVAETSKEEVSAKLRVKKKAKRTEIQEEFEDRDLLIPRMNHFFVKVSPNYEADVAEFLKTHLFADAIGQML